MYEYLLTGRTEDGDTTTEIVEAASGDEAVRAFERQGHTDIVLHTGETQAQLYRPSTLTRFLRPREIVDIRQMVVWQQTAFLIRKLYGRMWILVVLSVLPMAVYLALDWPLDWLVWGAPAVAFTPLLISLYIMLSGPGRNTDGSWRRSVGGGGGGLQLVPRVKMKLPEYELPLRKRKPCRARPHARGPDVFEKMDDQADFPGGVLGSVGAHLYHRSGPENALVALERAHELTPANPDLLIDLAGLATTGPQGSPAGEAALPKPTGTSFRTPRTVLPVAKD